LLVALARNTAIVVRISVPCCGAMKRVSKTTSHTARDGALSGGKPSTVVDCGG
jgi:hypothetical protein